MENKRKLVLSRHCNTKGFKSTDDFFHCGDPMCHNCNEDDRLFCEYVRNLSDREFGQYYARLINPLEPEQLAEIHNKISDNNPHMKIEKLTPSEVVEKYGHLLTIEQGRHINSILSKKGNSDLK